MDAVNDRFHPFGGNPHLFNHKFGDGDVATHRIFRHLGNPTFDFIEEAMKEGAFPEKRIGDQFPGQAALGVEDQRYFPEAELADEMTQNGPFVEMAVDDVRLFPPKDTKTFEKEQGVDVKFVPR